MLYNKSTNFLLITLLFCLLTTFIYKHIIYFNFIIFFIKKDPQLIVESLVLIRFMTVNLINSIPIVGVEPTLLTEPDFESGASANSAISARKWI